MPLMRRKGQQRIVPNHAVQSYQDAGWASDDTPAPENLDDLTAAQLRYRAKQADLPVSGTKAELIKRLGG